MIVSTDSAFSNIVIRDTLLVDTSKTVVGLVKDKKFYLSVKVKNTSGVTHNSSVWIFSTIPSIKINLKVLMEGMYYPFSI